MGHGTSLVVLQASDVAVMAADDLIYDLIDGVATPKGQRSKVFAIGPILVGTAQLVAYRLDRTIVGGELKPVPVEYEFQDWIADFVHKHRGATLDEPKRVASALYDECRQTMKPIQALLEHGLWKQNTPRDRLVTYVVAGYPKSFKCFHLIEFAAEVNPEGNGIRYITPFHHRTDGGVFFWLGEDQFLERAVSGAEPEASVRQREWAACLRVIPTILPKTPESLQDVIASAVSLVKVEAEFNPNKVGKTVNVAVVDRRARRTYRAIL